MNKNHIRISLYTALLLSTACAPTGKEKALIPAVEYSKKMRGATVEAGVITTAAEMKINAAASPGVQNAGMTNNEGMAQLRYVNDTQEIDPQNFDTREVVHNLNQKDSGYTVVESTMRNTRDYRGPLPLGDPGITASLWRESRGTNDIFRDQRAWQPMDLITILVTEDSEGSKEADTETISRSSFQAAISQLFNWEDELAEKNPGIDPTQMVNATTTNEYRGEGETTRRGRLRAKISAMVAEVLPSGILRIEGEKIISVNNEEQVMVISGLVRTRDITSGNEVDSAKIANLRIDYYGKGTVGEAQYPGWLGRIFRLIWPF